MKVEKDLDVDLPETEEHPNAVRLGWSVDEAGLGLGEALLSYGYGSTGKVVVNNRYTEYGEKYGPGDTIGCYLVCSLPSHFSCISLFLLFRFLSLLCPPSFSLLIFISYPSLFTVGFGKLTCYNLLLQERELFWNSLCSRQRCSWEGNLSSCVHKEYRNLPQL